MPTFLPDIRVAPRAVIIHADQLLLLRKHTAEGDPAYALPGGGLELGETLEQALQRECLEEIGSCVKIESLLYVADCFKPSSTHAPAQRHLVEIWFSCSIAADYVPVNGEHPDRHQVGVEWVDLNRLPTLNLQPPLLDRMLARVDQGAGALYLGELRAQ